MTGGLKCDSLDNRAVSPRIGTEPNGTLHFQLRGLLHKELLLHGVPDVLLAPALLHVYIVAPSKSTGMKPVMLGGWV